MKTFLLKAPNITQPVFRGIYDVFKRKPIVLCDKVVRWRNCAKIIGLSDKAKARLEWIIFYDQVANKDAYATAYHFGITPKTFYKWLDRFQESKGNLRSLEEQSRRPKRLRQREIVWEMEARIIKLRKKHMHWGKKKIRKLYQRYHKEIISTWKIETVIRFYKLYPNKKKAADKALKIQKAKQKPKKRITALTIEPKLWFLIHLDTIVIYYGSIKRYILTAVDHHGKFAYARMYKNKSSRSAKDFLYRLHFLIEEYTPNAQTDEGSEFKGEFEEALADLEITRYFSRVKTPQDNSPVERFNQTLEYEWLYDGNFDENTDRFNKTLTKWLEEYNFVRPHESLNYLTPMEFIEQTMLESKKQTDVAYQINQNLLPMYPARTFY